MIFIDFVDLLFMKFLAVMLHSNKNVKFHTDLLIKMKVKVQFHGSISVK